MKKKLVFVGLLMLLLMLMVLPAHAATCTNGHQWGSPTTTKAATCTHPGPKQYTCTRCGTAKTETIPKLGHNMSGWHTTQEAQCALDGIQENRCLRTGCTYKETRAIGANGHTFSGWSIVKAADCIHTGQKRRSCAVC